MTLKYFWKGFDTAAASIAASQAGGGFSSGSTLALISGATSLT